MTTKEWLSRGYKIDGEINVLLEEKQAVYSQILSVSSMRYGDKVKSSPKNTAEEMLVNYLTYEEKINKRIDQLILVKDEILKVIMKVKDPILRQLLELRYLRFQTWEKIAENLEYSDKWVRTNLHSKAIWEVREILEK